MVKDKFYYEALTIYNEVFDAYKDLIKNYTFKIYKINKHEKVILVEDSFIVYLGLIEKYPNWSFKEKENHYTFFSNTIEMLYSIRIEELLPNEVFKFVGTKFTEQFNLDSYRLFDIVYYSGTKFSHGSLFADNCRNYFEYVNHALRKLHLRDRYEKWTGWLYHFIVYEVIDYENNRCYCIYPTKNSSPNITAIKKFKEIDELIFCYSYLPKNEFNKEVLKYAKKGLLFNDEFQIIAHAIINSPQFKKSHFKLYNHLAFCIVDKNIKEFTDLDAVSNKVFKQAINGEFNSLEKIEYIEEPIKWKSEYLVKELCEKLFGKNNVIFQHRPYFLHTDKGQLSYDVYLTKYKIAIEYQGKQHYEPIDFFGGDKTFQLQQKRDEIKQILSKQNNIRIIYITYKDPITKEFIAKKVTEAINNT